MKIIHIIVLEKSLYSFKSFMFRHKKIMSETLLIDFKTQVVQFISELSQQFPNYKEFALASIAIQYMEPNVLMEKAIEFMDPFRQQILTKDENFFLNNQLSNENIIQSHITHIKQLWTSNQLDDDDKDVIWDWFKMFIVIIDKHRKSKLN